MENNQFDNEIKKMLEGLEVPFQDLHWDRMAQRLQETQEPNTSDTVTAFDKSISEKISGFEVPFSESSWIALRSRLVASAYLKKWIFQTKTIEGLFMLVFALFLMDSIGEEPKAPVYHGPVAQVKTIHIDNKPTSEITHLAAEVADEHQAGSRLATNDETRNQGNHFVIDNSSTSPIAGILLASVPVDKKEVAIVVNARKINVPDFASGIDARGVLLEVPDYLSNPLVMLDVPNQLDLALPRIAFNQASKTNFGLSVYGIVNADHIITGVDPTTAINVPNVWSPGYGGGIAFSKRKGRLAISAGVEYQEVKYFPKPIIRITQGGADLGYAGAGTTTVELTKVSLPITIGYPLINTQKHQLSVELGLLPAVGKETFEQSTFIVGNSNKENDRVLRQKMAAVGAQPTVYVQPTVAPRYTEPQTETSRLSKKPKFFASARANISYEYKLDRHHSIFAKASYSHQLTQNGIGLPKDRLNTVGLHFGSRVYL